MILVCGEALFDLEALPGRRDRPAEPTRFEAHPGGGPANTAVAVARLGTEVALCGRLSGDAFGRILRSNLARNGVDLRYAVAAEEPSSLAVVTVDEQGLADYAFHVTGTADWMWTPEELPRELPGSVVALHAGSLALALPPGRDVLAGLLRREMDHRTISIDPNVRPRLVGGREQYRRRVQDWVGIADLVRASDEDLGWIYPGASPVEMARRWAAEGPAMVVLTLDRDGSVAFVAGEEVRAPAVPVRVVDTVGAGDSYTAGLLDWLARSGRLGPGALAAVRPAEACEALGFAARVAAITCTRAGADPPWRAELSEAPSLRR